MTLNTLFDESLAGPFSKPEYEIFNGKFVKVKQLVPDDMTSLYQHTHTLEDQKKVWDYLSCGPFNSVDDMSAYYQKKQSATDKLIFCIQDVATEEAIGTAGLINIDTEMGTIETGDILVCANHQRSKALTETIYLLLKYCFDQLGYRRVVWKCNNDNIKSKQAALRLGYEFEGLFKKHMIVKNKNRDTAWFVMLDDRWKKVAVNYERWLYHESGENLSLAVLNNG